MSVVIETTIGDITVDLFVKERPKACLNFIKLCKLKYYNFNLFHTIEPGFIAQTGDPTGDGDKGESVWGVIEGPKKKLFEAELIPKIFHSEAGLLRFVYILFLHRWNFQQRIILFLAWCQQVRTSLDHSSSSHLELTLRRSMEFIALLVKWLKDTKCWDSSMKPSLMINTDHTRTSESLTQLSLKILTLIQEASVNPAEVLRLRLNVSEMEESQLTRTSMTSKAKPRLKFKKCCKTEKQRLVRQSSRLLVISQTPMLRLLRTSCSCVNWIRSQPTTIFKSFSADSVKSRPAKWYETKCRATPCNIRSLSSRSRNPAKTLTSRWTTF